MFIYSTCSKYFSIAHAQNNLKYFQILQCPDPQNLLTSIYFDGRIRWILLTNDLNIQYKTTSRQLSNMYMKNARRYLQ